MATWGALSFNISYRSYRPPHSEAKINEIDILADPSDFGARATVLQQGGRRRKRALFEVIGTYAQHQSFQTDWNNGEVRNFNGPHAVDFSAVIMNVSDPVYVQDGLIRFNVELIEA